MVVRCAIHWCRVSRSPKRSVVSWWWKKARVPYSREEYDQAVYDLVNFLYYTGDPSRLERHRTGYLVILFLVILFAFTFLLGREYQKDVRH